MDLTRKKIKYSELPFAFVLAVISYIEGLIIYINAENWDYGQHTKIAKLILGSEIDPDSFQAGKQALAYPMYHVLIKLMHIVGKLDYPFVVALLMVVCILASVLCVRELIIELSHRQNSYLVDFLSIFSIVFIVARGPLTHFRFYIFITGPNPIQSPTYILVRPFAIVCFYFFCRLFSGYNANKSAKISDLLGFGVFSLLSVLAKPSFATVFLPAMGLYTLVVMIKNKDLRIGIKTLISVLPSVIILFWQRYYITSNTGMLKVSIHFGSFSDLGLADVIMVTICMIPSALLLINSQQLRNNVYYQIAFMAYIIGWLQFYFLDNGNSGDFGWGYALSTTIFTVVSLSLSLDDGQQYKFGKIRIPLAWLLFAYQCLMGLLYLYKVYKFGEYWI